MPPIHDLSAIDRFVGSELPRATLGLVYGRRRIGKSTALAQLCQTHGGFYWEATRGETAIHLARLGEALGAHLGVGPLHLASWEDALPRLLALGVAPQATPAATGVPVVLDEFGYLLEAAPGLDSIIANALGPSQRSTPRSSRLILCGSAMAMMQKLTSGEAPLRGRAALELIMHPVGFRHAATLLSTPSDVVLAARIFAVIGGVVGYATDMVDDDLPRDGEDFERWVSQRVLSPASPLYHEATTLLAEDPTLAAASSTLHHSILGVIANGAITAGTIANALRRQVPTFDVALKRLIAAGFVVRHEDPIRGRRPMYALGDPFLQFHFAVLEPYRTALRARDPLVVWRDRLASVFDARVRGPVFEEQARSWVRRYASTETLGGPADHVGPSLVTVQGVEHQLDVVVAASMDASAGASDGMVDEPGKRRVLSIGEAKAGEVMREQHLHRLEQARTALGASAAHAKLLLFGPRFSPELVRLSHQRSDVELIDLERLYHGQ